MVDGYQTRSTGEIRTLITPPIEPGKEFQYTLKAELNRDGQTLTTTSKVAVRTGQETWVNLIFPTGVARR
jgi:uncharacterized protein (TIGR03000 family)